MKVVMMMDNDGRRVMAITYSNLDRFAQPALGRHESY
eukprot:CAMPEP_0197561420 /NCGR_PEP_ID=MMETSP1320-20131121/25152_1 /TAXON_ID=91990 /ORGANISM="Bolidomonas sp., Strain RCC2347" /LENGTH=36 /DNA_ID= /DNA_START= /DNA_END= /DNA_ORIENTATION=